SVTLVGVRALCPPVLAVGLVAASAELAVLRTRATTATVVIRARIERPPGAFRNYLGEPATSSGVAVRQRTTRFCPRSSLRGKVIDQKLGGVTCRTPQ